MRTQRNLVRTQRGMVYKFKCALNESALNEVRTQRGIVVLTYPSIHSLNLELNFTVLVPLTFLNFSIFTTSKRIDFTDFYLA